MGTRIVAAATFAFASAVLLAPSMSVAADDPAAAADAPMLNTIEVLGSHISRVDIETQHPIVVINREEILRTGLSSISDVVQNMVFNGQTLNRLVNNGGNGEMLANLRSLGFQRTLVLLNGQRFVTDIGGAVDLSAIPLAMVDRIEVLLDSASAIYGSDAIAGVINIITRRDYDGGELGAYFAQTDHDDGQREAWELSYGHKGDGWSAAAGIEYSKDNPVYAGNREISAVPAFGLPPTATGSSFTPYTWLTLESGAVVRLRDNAPGASPDDFRDVDRVRDRYNYVPLNYLQTPQERRALYAQARYEFSSNLALNADVLANQRRSNQQLAEAATSTNAFNTGATDAIAISPDNVYNPFGEPVVGMQRRLVEAGPRTFEQTADTYRIHTGLDGLFNLAGRDFAWGADAIATRARVTESTGPYADNRKLAPALGPSFFDAGGVARCGTAAAPIADCVPVNLFGPPGSLTPAMLDYIAASEVNRTQNDTRNLDSHVTTNQLFELPAGSVALAAGLSYRRESGSQIVDPLRASGNENGNGTTYDSTSGAYSVTEAYLEFDVPLLAEQPFARRLDFTVGTRYSNYTNFGGTTNSQFGMRWKPIDDVLMRANYAQGFRAPSVAELFQGATLRPGEILDPCDPANEPSATTVARCNALGVPANVDSSVALSNVTAGGNKQLHPETSTSWGAGFVYTPAWLSGFDVSIDWYDIKLHEAIGDPGEQAVVDDCYLRSDDAACAHIVRDPANGTVFHVTDLIQNARGGIETEGFDLTLNWRQDTPIGRLSAHWLTNYVDYFGEVGQPDANAALADGSLAQGNTVGLNSPSATNLGFGVIWRWRSQLQLAWQNGPWSAAITGRYFDDIVESCQLVFMTAGRLRDPSLRKLCSNPDQTVLIGNNEVPMNRVPSATFFDIETTWNAPWQAFITFGVRNAFDRTPPVSYSAFANSFFPEYDIPGRFFYMRYRQRF